MCEYTQIKYRRSLSRLLVVVSAVWLAPATADDTESDCIKKTRVIDAEMPNLNGDQRALIVQAMDLDRHEPHPTCSFELDATLDYIPSRIERYDAQSENESPWTLVSIEDREPRERERNKTPRYTRMTPEDAWYDLRHNTDWDSLKVEHESAERVSYVGLKNIEVGKDEFVPGGVMLEIDKATRSLQTAKITMNEKHKINFFATIAAMTMTQNYRYEPDMVRSILDELSVDWKFKFFFAPASSTERITYRDYDCRPSSLIPSCSE